MKKLLVILSILTSLPAFAGEEVQVGVKGMVCAFCAQGIEKKFKGEPAVEKIKVSLEKKYVKLTFKDGQKLSKEKISELLKDAGYEAVFDGTK
ncbi:MAG: cation transporter [Oligoflexia bacterium]|nr:cation transporter [Oligoflexia bacterium]